MSTTRMYTNASSSSASSECGSVSTIALIPPAPVLSSPSSYWDLDNVEALSLSRTKFRDLAEGADAPRHARAILEWLKAEESSYANCSSKKHLLIELCQASGSPSVLLDLDPRVLKHVIDSSKDALTPETVKEVLQNTGTLKNVSSIDLATLERYVDYQRYYRSYPYKLRITDEASTPQAKSFLLRLLFVSILSTRKVALNLLRKF